MNRVRNVCLALQRTPMQSPDITNCWSFR